MKIKLTSQRVENKVDEEIYKRISFYENKSDSRGEENPERQEL